jgi:RNase P subunit RPR2
MSLLPFCSHSRTTFPQTHTQDSRGRAISPRPAGPHVTCLECGQEFRYNWEQMRIERSPISRRDREQTGQLPLAAGWLPSVLRVFWQR